MRTHRSGRSGRHYPPHAVAQEEWSQLPHQRTDKVIQAEFELVRKLKETKCSISTYAVEKDEERKMKEIKDKYTLPDGSVLELSNERTLAGEILFAPERIGLEYPCMSDI